MGPTGVVEADPGDQSLAEGGAGFIGVDVDAFVLQGSPQALDEDVVHPAASSVHADFYSGIPQYGRKSGAGKLASLIRVENLWTAEAGQSLFQRLDAEIHLHGVG